MVLPVVAAPQERLSVSGISKVHRVCPGLYFKQNYLYVFSVYGSRFLQRL